MNRETETAMSKLVGDLARQVLDDMSKPNLLNPTIGQQAKDQHNMPADEVKEVFDKAVKDTLFTRVEHDFALHPPRTPEVAETLDRIRGMYTAMASDVINLCPVGRDLSMAMTDLETSMRCAIAAIVKNQ